MTYAAILTHVQADPERAPRLACAIAIARRFGAEIHGVGDFSGLSTISMDIDPTI